MVDLGTVGGVTGKRDAVCVRSAAAAVAGVLVVSSLALAGCAATYPMPRAPVGDPIEAARALSDAPDALQESRAATSCGEFVLVRDESVPVEAVTCLDAAAAEGSQAELAWSYPTSEGDPIVYFASVASWNENVVLFMTNSFDSYGGDFGWTIQSCFDAATAVNAYFADGCQDLVEG